MEETEPEPSGSAGAVSIPLDEPSRDEPSPKVDDELTRKNWYLGGELSTEAVESVLNASKSTNCFGVYKSDEDNYILSTKYQVPDADDDLMDHMEIQKRNNGKFKISGQSVSYEDIIKAVEDFVVTFDPPLLPALHGSSYETQISIADDPPDYESANRVLKPDIATLPDITSIRVDSVKEAKTGRISPSTSGYDLPGGGNRIGRHRGAYHPAHGARLSQWHHYDDHVCCHPKNVCYGCCYRRVEWNGYRYAKKYKWFDCRGSGPLRVLGLLIFWLLCGLCFGCFKCCTVLCTICCYVCCGFYDSS